MKQNIFFPLAIAAPFMFTSSVLAGNPAHIQRLLTTNECIGCDLSNEDLRFAHLIGADLREANLSGSTLIEANLEGADMTGANLKGSNLTEAIVTNASLNDSN
ncbi:MAG: pentapeptide repeat-containing protein, partial [cyanobacterium endosymbiont of Rhopalodia inflata]